MKVVFVALQHDYGDPQRGPSFEVTTFDSSLRGMGHSIHPFDAYALSLAMGGRRTQDALRALVEETRPDVVLAVPFGFEVSGSTYRAIRDELKVPVIAWFSDDHWRYESFSQAIAPNLTSSVTTSYDAYEKYRRDGFPCILSQWGYASDGLRPPANAVIARDVVLFVGQTYGHRRTYLNLVARRLSAIARVEVYGHRSRGGRVTAGEMARLFAISQVTLNFTDSWSPGVLSRMRHRDFSRRARPPQIKARIFEVTGCGGLLVTEDAPGLDQYFQPGVEVAVFQDRRDLLAIVSKAILEPEWRDQVAALGRKRCLTEHTMASRLKRIFNLVLGSGP